VCTSAGAWPCWQGWPPGRLAAYLSLTSVALSARCLRAVTALFASVMVLWLGVWMHDRRHAAAWQDYIKSSLVGGGGRFGFAVLAFFSVYRELFEVILFYETLWLQAGPARHMAWSWRWCRCRFGVAAWLGLGDSARFTRSCRWQPSSVHQRACCSAYSRWCLPATVWRPCKKPACFGTHPVAFFEFDWLGIHADAYWACRPGRRAGGHCAVLWA
jgi:high-affinity iron transporter